METSELSKSCSVLHVSMKGDPMTTTLLGPINLSSVPALSVSVSLSDSLEGETRGGDGTRTRRFTLQLSRGETRRACCAHSLKPPASLSVKSQGRGGLGVKQVLKLCQAGPEGV